MSPIATPPVPTYLKTNRASLYLGSLNLLGTTTDLLGNQYNIEALAAESTMGQPVPIDVAVQRWMTDGAVATTQGHDNREIFFKIKVNAVNSIALAAAESALTRLSNAITTLTWTPPQGPGLAPSTVFEIWTWHLEPDFDIDGENRITRYYGVRMTAKPWARSLNLTTVTANPTTGSPTITSIDTCSATTGWTGYPNAMTTTGSVIKETAAITGGAGSGVVAQGTRVGTAVTVGTQPYLMLDMSMAGPVGTVSWGVSVGSGGPLVGLTKVAQIGSTSYWQIPATITSFTTILISVGGFATKASGNLVLTINDVSKTDVVGGIGSHKQLALQMPVGGAVPTSGSIQVASPSATTLGNVLVYSCPDSGSGYSPPLRQYRTSGNTVTVDATCVSGNREALVTAGAGAGLITYTIPAGVLPEGTYVLVGRFLFSAAATMTVQAGAKTSATGSPSDALVGSGQVVATGAVPTWGIMGTFSLPTQQLPAESTVSTIITLLATATASATITVDELYIFDVTRGAFTLLLAGSTAHTRIWLDAPDADLVRNRPAIYVGTQADRSDAARIPYTQILSMGDHDLDEGGASLLVVTDGVNDAATSASFYHRWLSNAGD